MADRQYLADYSENVQNQLYDGHKIAAIRMVREEQGMELTQAKAYVEELERKLREAYPEAMPEPKKTTGCASLIAIPLLVLTAWGLWS